MKKSLTTKFVLAFTCIAMLLAGFVTLGLNAKPQKVLASTEHDHATGWAEWTATSGAITASGNYYLADEKDLRMVGDSNNRDRVRNSVWQRRIRNIRVIL